VKLPRLSKFPLDKPFERQEASTSLSEIALRLVVDFYSDVPAIVGTATVLSGHLLVTAKHVLDFIPTNSSILDNPQKIEVDGHFVAVQVLTGPEYIIWDVLEAISDPATDIALLRLASNPTRSSPDTVPKWSQPQVNPFPPDIKERVAAFGYRLGAVQVSKNADGGNHIDLNDEPMMSVGVVRDIHEWKRDNVRMPFPSYQVSSRFDGGMSGGPVFDETGCLCGIVCSGIEGSHLEEEPISYVSTLWPMFRLIISGDRGDEYPRGVRYPVIELARGGQIAVPDLPRLENWFEQHIKSETDC
jgi:hypothetical protein